MTRPDQRTNACTELAQMEVLDRLRERQAAPFSAASGSRLDPRSAVARPSAVLGGLRRIGNSLVVLIARRGG